MFDKTSRPDGAGKGSAVYRGISALGTALGIGAAILAGPIAFEWTKKPLLAHLAKTYSHDVANVLTWVMAGVEGFIIYICTKLLFSFVTIWAMAAVAARRFPVG